MQARVFLNSKSGTSEASPEELRKLFAAHGIAAEFPPLDRLADAAKSEPADLLFVAAGGDGTIRAVAEAVAGTSRPFAVLALGTLNHFARDLKLPLELKDAVALIAQARPAPVDTAEVNGVTFVNNSSLGAYPAMVMDRERMKKTGHNKWLSLVAASFQAFIRFRKLTVTLCIAGETRTCTTPFLFIGNNEYCVEGTRLGHRDSLTGGTLSLYLAPNATRGTMLRFLAAAALGRLESLKDFHTHLVSEFSVAAPFRRRLRVSVDGEVRRMAGPLTYRIRPRSLEVLQPPPPPPPGQEPRS